jgi:hypothetical protein
MINPRKPAHDSFGRDRTRAHALEVEGFHPRSCDGGVGSPVHPRPVSRGPPTIPDGGLSPRPVLTLASRRSPAQRARSFSAAPQTPRCAMVDFPGRAMVPRPHRFRGLRERPRAQRPWARSRCDLCRPGVSPQVRGPSPTVSARTDACASPHPARRLGWPLGPWGCAGGCPPRLGGGLSRRCAAPLALRAWPPTPAARGVHRPGSSATTAACPACGPGQRPANPVQRLPYGTLVRGCSHARLCRPADWLTTQVAPPATDTSVGPLWVLRPSLSWCVPSPRLG